MSAAVIHNVTIHRLAIPMRVSVRHAAAARATADPVVVELELNNGVRGFGETLARPYVTGETGDSAARAIEQVFVPVLLEFHPQSFPEALEFIEALPWRDAMDVPIPAAKAAVELALLDASMRRFDRGVDDVVQWMGLPGFGSPGCSRNVRFSGVLATDDMRVMMRQLRLMYWYGLRHFKLKVGTEADLDRVRAAARYLASPLAKASASLRVDANGAWSVDEAAEWLSAAGDLPLAGIEQPLPRGQEEALPDLHGGSDALFIHDESFVSEKDARKLIDLGVADVLNIRIAKCGGLIPSLRLAALARKNGVKVQLGCMVGETSILSAAGLRFLEVSPEVHWSEGCFGSFLLRGDVVKRPLRFGYGGRPPKLGPPGLGIVPDDSLMEFFSAIPPKLFNL